MTGRQRFRRYLIWIFWVSLLFTFGFTWYYMDRRIPDSFHIVANEQEVLDLELPFDVTLMSDSEEVVLGQPSNIPSGEVRLKVEEPLTLFANKEGSYQLDMKLFGTIPLKEIRLDVGNSEYAIPCGLPVGIYLKSKGIMVIGTGRILDAQGKEVEPACGVLRSGDYIEAINGEPLRDKEALITNLNHMKGGEALLRIRREGQQMDIAVQPVKTEDGTYKLGAWVRDDTQGIGTMTYIDSRGEFGALGHGISDSDTGQVVEMAEGALYDTEILGIEKGEAGSPGVMAGVIYYGSGSRLGTVSSNRETGIFGRVDERLRQKLSAQPVEIGHRQDVKKGQAWIRSNVSGTLRDYEIEIQRVDYNPVQRNKSMVLRVVDEDLLRLTGGIVQGMFASYNGNNTRKPSKIKGLRCSSPISLTKKRLVFCAKYN